MRLALAVLVVTLPLCACRSVAHDREASLLAADRAFCADVQARRLEGWVAAFDVNGSQFDEQFRPVTGHAAIRAHMAELASNPDLELTWEPDAAVVSEAGNLGSTTGRWTMSERDSAGKRAITATGRYFDVWRRLPDGTWKLVVDLGEPDADPSTAP
ncbi:MAG: nuclear transport factor 2 family protein [Planctomycetota bacterium]|nr:nuclear transport factor 2 family protein [Planctomycetota bacterium]